LLRCLLVYKFLLAINKKLTAIDSERKIVQKKVQTKKLDSSEWVAANLDNPKILNGGKDLWINEGRAVTKEIPAIKPPAYPVENKSLEK
jgi:hypothetical protein